MDPMVGSAAACDNQGAIISDSSDNADLLDFCFLCSRQFFHVTLDDYGTERLKDEDVLETFFEELGPVDRSLLQCCPSCKALCKTLTRTREALSSLIDEIINLLLRSRKVSFLLSKSRVVSRLFQSSNSSLPPCETSSSYLQQPLSQINFSSKDASTTPNPLPDCFPTQFDLRLDSTSNLSVSDLDLGLTTTQSTPTSVIKRSPLSIKKNKKQKATKNNVSDNSNFSSIYNESMMNSISDNACDISEGVIRQHQKDIFLPPAPTPSPNKASNPDAVKCCKDSSSIGTTSVLTFGSARKIDESEKVVTDSQSPVGEAEPVETACTEENRDEGKQFGTTQKRDNVRNFFPEKVSSSSPPKEGNGIQGQVTELKIFSRHFCAPCNKSFKSARSLRNHLGAHNQERKFICEICGVSYRHKIGLEAHVSIHKGDSKFRCEICDKSFTQKSGLERHLRIHTKKFEFQCDTCGKQFLHHSSFSAHKLVHKGARVFKCTHCELSFLQNSHLRRHLRIHTGEKPFKCELCTQSFSEKYNLQVHIKTHEFDPSNLFKCPKCFKSFTRKFKLKQHMKKVHCAQTLL